MRSVLFLALRLYLPIEELAKESLLQLWKNKKQKNRIINNAIVEKIIFRFDDLKEKTNIKIPPFYKSLCVLR